MKTLMDSQVVRHAQPTSKPSWLGDTLRQFNFLKALRERNHVRRTCVDAMKLYREAEAEMPQADSQERYARVVARRTGADAVAVATILRRAAESFALWPNERPLRFRDVVHYLAITEFLDADPASSGIRTRVDVVVAELIPARL